MLHTQLQTSARAHRAAPAEPIVYLIDDEPALRRISCYLIGALGLTCVPYSFGEDFLRDVETLEPGCILLDVAMEPMNGFDVQRELRRRAIGWPIVFMSGALKVRADSLEATLGMVAFLEKPFCDEELMSALHKGFTQLKKARL
jgi:two-component system, LuxR family, response regulator FixJ